MTLFTKNPLERLMMQRPYPGKEETPRNPCPGGAFLPWLRAVWAGLRPALLPGHRPAGKGGAEKAGAVFVTFL